MFPRLQKRGPIEATLARLPVLRRGGFHAYKSVAPLKPLRPRQRAERDQCVSTLTKAWPH